MTGGGGRTQADVVWQISMKPPLITPRDLTGAVLVALGRGLAMVWGQSRTSSESAEVDPSPAVKGDGAPGTCEALGEVQVVSQLGWPIAYED